MSVLRPKPPEDPISLTLGQWEAPARVCLARFAEAARARIAESLAARQLLTAYMTDRPASELFQALTVARRLRESVDAVVVICAEPVGHALKGLFETCCHPFHNHLSRGERGGRPRLFFAGGVGDPDRTAGLADLMAASRSDDLLDRWGVVRIASQVPRVKGGAGDLAASSLDVAAAGARSDNRGAPTANLRLTVPPGPAADVFNPAVLTTASAAGIDVVRLLGGGVAMLRRFLESPTESNPPMLLAAAMQAAAEAPDPSTLSLTIEQTPAAASVARWWAAESGTFTPGPSHAFHACRLVVREPRRGGPQHVRSHLLPEAPLLASAPPLAAAPSLAIDLPRLDEHTVGQLFALRLLALRLLAEPGSLATVPPQA